jgi:predicted MFS family arabinose efflux permease
LDNIPLYKTNPSMYHNSISMLRLDVIDEEEPKQSECCGEEARRTLQELMDFRLFFDVVFVLFAVSNLLTSVGFVVPYIFLPERGANMNLSENEIPWLISAIGISNTIGRVLFGYIADFKCINRLMLYNTVLVLCGLVSIFSYLCYNFAMLMVFSFLFGCMIGKYSCSFSFD